MKKKQYALPQAHGIQLKKKYGQHFLRDQSVVDSMLDAIHLEHASVFEIGPGDGFLTRSILAHPIQRLWCYEIDPEWATFLKDSISDPRLTIYKENFLDIDFEPLRAYAPWSVLSNLPYQVTFPILHLLVKHRDLIKEGVVMVQEEVAQKILKTSGRGYGYVSLFFQHYFEWKMLSKIPPTAFDPPPKVYSRLLQFKPKAKVKPIVEEERFWKFIKLCFRLPRRTLRNNLASTHINMALLDEKTLNLRAQQMTMDDFLKLWKKVRQP